MDAKTFNAAKVELEQAYFSHMIDRKEYLEELKELRKERQDDRVALLEPVKPVEKEAPPLTQRRLYPVHKMKLYRSRRKQIFFSGERRRRNSRTFIRRRT